eukprot:TRINITY_DN3032_c0_g2_i1.p1 TRINITY_DN3032_c0_g2~~TRINITY_DN3032_c0_g2_i1.p1  ORF type:complete len:353 (-),score=66.11 TRINITY_DN3032_c0_g2_i1:516-1574(-)
MDGNKDEALRCIGMAKSALASGDKNRALKFIKIAQRLDSNLSVDDLLLACEGLDSSPSASSAQEKPIDEEILEDMGPKKAPNSANGVRNYTDENVELIREIKRHKDYYAILGVEKSCTVEEVRKAYHKLSLKVHPDKNKAPGSEEAFKMVSKAFKCLSDEESRRRYDQTGLIEEFEYNQQYNVRRRRRRTRQDIFDENVDPDEIFRSFFFGSQQEVFRNAHVYRSRGMGAQTGNVDGFRFSFMTILQILPFLFIFLVVYLPFSEPTYALYKAYSYEIPKVTEKYGVEYFVKTSTFDQQFPPGSPSRANLENQVVREYRNMLGRYCHLELQRRQWVRNYPTPHCDKMQNFGAA